MNRAYETPRGWTNVERHGRTWLLISDAGGAVVAEAREIIDGMEEGLGRELMMVAPYHTVTVYLMRDEAALQSLHHDMFGETLDTPYGFYEDNLRIIAVNVDAGFGPLAHEVTHPMLDANMPDCPPWFDEGLASLYEDSYSTDDGLRRGMLNWRLPMMQEAAASGEADLLEVLAMDRDEFYALPHAMNYAIARHFMFWLQETGMLAEFYEEFSARGSGADPVTLIEDVFDMPFFEVENEWLDWVMTL